jgi:hypothetical protein
VSDTDAQQLTFDVGGNPPDLSILRVSGGAMLHKELAKGDEVHMIVSGMDGEIVADGYGRVVAVAFKDKLDEHGVVTATERIQTIRIT